MKRAMPNLSAERMAGPAGLSRFGSRGRARHRSPQRSMHSMKYPVILCLLSVFASPGLAGEFYQQFRSSIGTNADNCVALDSYPFLVDTNNTGAKLTNTLVNLRDLKERGEISGLRLGMPMDEAIARWGKPPYGWGPVGCLHGLATFNYSDASLGFESNRLETVVFGPRDKMFGVLSRHSRPEEFIGALGSPTDRRAAGHTCHLVYLSPNASLRLVFLDDELDSVWLEHTPSRAQPWKQEPRANPQGGASRRQPFSSETNRTSAAAASRRSP